MQSARRPSSRLLDLCFCDLAVLVLEVKARSPVAAAFLRDAGSPSECGLFACLILRAPTPPFKAHRGTLRAGSTGAVCTSIRTSGDGVQAQPFARREAPSID
jgi:hypothetical protein